MSIRIASLHFHPIKSCGALDVPSLDIGDRGPFWDREWMIVDEATNQFITQRQYPKMALVRPELISATLPSGILKIKIPGVPPLQIPLNRLDGDIRSVRVWNDDCVAWDEGDTAAHALSVFLGLKVRLVRMVQDFERHLAPKYGHPGAHTGFADAFPFLLTSLGSLEELNSRLATPVPMSRFRPNIVIEGAAAYAEDTWKTIRIGTLEFDVAKACSRCVMINNDQITGEKSAEPLKTLAGYRRDPETNKVLFGQNLIHLSEGTLRVGDEVEIIAVK